MRANGIVIKTARDRRRCSEYIAEKSPDTAVRFSELGYMKNGAITNLPPYPVSAAERSL